MTTKVERGSRVPLGPVSVELPADARSVAAARKVVRSTLSGWDLDHLCDTVTLLTSELATNAILHARTPLLLQLERRSGALRVTVADNNPSTPHRRTNGLQAGTGRGLALIETMAEVWGTDRPFRGHAKGVWFELLEDGSRPAASDEGLIYGENWLALAEDRSR